MCSFVCVPLSPAVTGSWAHLPKAQSQGPEAKGTVRKTVWGQEGSLEWETLAAGYLALRALWFGSLLSPTYTHYPDPLPRETP